MDDRLVYSYEVYWENEYLTHNPLWKHKEFASKKEAQKFAKAHISKGSRKPYIDRFIVPRYYFKEDVQVEFVESLKDIAAYNSTYTKKAIRKMVRY